MLRGMASYLPGAGWLFGAVEEEKEGDEVDLNKRPYDPSNKKHVEYLQLQAKSSNRYYKNLEWHDRKNIGLPLGATALLEYNNGLNLFFSMIFLAVFMAYIAYYLLGGKFKERQQLSDRFYKKTDEMVELHALLVEQHAAAMEVARATGKMKEMDVSNPKSVEITVVEDGLSRKIKAIIDDNYVLKFGQKKIQFEIEESDGKGKTIATTKTVIIDDEALLALLKNLARFTTSEELVAPYIKHSFNRADLSPAILQLLTKPPHNILFCPTKEEMEAAQKVDKEQLILVQGPANSVGNLIENYTAHTRFFFYGRGKSSLPTIAATVETVKEKASALVGTEVARVMQSKMG